MLKVSKILVAAYKPEIYLHDDQWVIKVEKVNFSGGYYQPANFSGHPDNWYPAEGEDPDITNFSVLFTDYGEGDQPQTQTYIHWDPNGFQIRGPQPPQEVLDYLQSQNFENELLDYYGRSEF